MFKIFKGLLRAASLVILMGAMIPVNHPAFAAAPLPPVDMFQLPWEQGLAWVALDGFDNGTRRSTGSPHNYLNGGAIDFAPHTNMKKGEDTSNAWVTAAAAGTVVEISKCHLKLAHANAWVTEYQHLANFQVKLGDVVARNQRLAVIANASTQPVCLGSVETDIPHLHFALRPNMVGATFAGWEFKYNALFGSTTFTKDGVSVGLFKPLLNTMNLPATATPPGPTATSQSTATVTPPSGPYVSTSTSPGSIQAGETALVTVSLNNVPAAGYTSAEFTCTYNPLLVEAGNIVFAGLFGSDSATAIYGPQNGSFIVAIAGSKGNRATTSGVVFTFTARGLQAGLTSIGCSARVSQGSNILTDLPSIGTTLTILGSSSTPTLTSTSVAPSSTPAATATSTIPTDLPTSSPTTTSTIVPTPTSTPVPTDSPTPAFSPTATRVPQAGLSGQVIATKVVTVRVYGLDQALVAEVNANPDGTFRFDLAPGSYTLVATANGFLRAEGSITLADGDNRSMPVIALLAGDIDDNNAIDQFDAMAIGFNYGGTQPPGADLNNDGIINVLDLELLARNYRKTGPVPWP